MTLKIDHRNAALRIPSSLKDNSMRMLTPSEIDWLRQNLKASYKELLRIAEERDRQANPA